MAGTTNGLGQLLGAAIARASAAGGVAVNGVSMMLGEGAVAEVGEVLVTDKGLKKRTVTIVLLGGDTRDPQIIRGKLVGDLCALGEGLEPYTRVRFLGTYRLFAINGKTYPTVTLAEIERVTASSSRGEAA